ncbi:MAG: glycosyltransferase [Spirochaetia bacterium]|nr:glycosyltransferase [Spirochaetia bacterium]
MTKLEKANAAMREKKYDEALELYKEIIREYPKIGMYITTNIIISEKRLNVINKSFKYGNIVSKADNNPIESKQIIICFGSFNKYKLKFVEILDRSSQKYNSQFLWIQDTENTTYDKQKIKFSPLFIKDISFDKLDDRFESENLLDELEKYNFLAVLHGNTKDEILTIKKFNEEAFKLNYFLCTNNIKLVLIWHQFRPLGHIMQYLCMKYDIPYFFIEWGVLPGTLSVDKLGQMALSHVTKLDIEEQREKTNPISYKRAACYLAFANLNNFRRRVNKNEIVDLDEITNFQKLNGKKIIFFAGANDPYAGIGSDKDPYFKKHSPLGLNTFESVVELLKFAEEIGFFIIFKPHPHSPEETEKQKDILRKYNAFITVGREFSFNSCIENADLIVTTVSQTAYAALIKSKPVLLLGKMQLSNKGCCWELHKLRDLKVKLLSSLKYGLLEEQRRNFILHVSYLIEHELFSYDGGVLDSENGVGDEEIVKRLLGRKRDAVVLLDKLFLNDNINSHKTNDQELYLKSEIDDLQWLHSVRVVFYCMSPPSGLSGGRLHAWLMAASLADFGFSVTFVTNCEPIYIQDDYKNDYPIGKSIKYQFFDIENKKINFDSLSSDIFIYVPHASCHGVYTSNALDYIQKASPKVVLLNFESENFFNKYSPKKKPSIHWQGWYEIATNADLILSSTKISNKYAVDDYHQVKSSTIFDYCYPPLNFTSIRGVKSTKKTKSIVSFVRTSAAHKGSSLLIDVLSEDLRGYTYHIISGRELSLDFKKEFLEKAKSIGVQVEIHIAIDEKTKFEILSQAHLHLFPSFFEGFGLPPIEAASVGTITLAFDIPVLREVNHNRAVFFAQYGNAADLKKKLKELLNYEYDPVDVINHSYPNSSPQLYQSRIATTMLALIDNKRLNKLFKSKEVEKETSDKKKETFINKKNLDFKWGISNSKFEPNGEISIRGWSLSKKRIEKIEIWIKGKYIGNALIGLLRNDVYNKFQDFNNRNSGFYYRAIVKNIKLNEATTFELHFYDETGFVKKVKDQFHTVSTLIPDLNSPNLNLITIDKLNKIELGMYTCRHKKFNVGNENYEQKVVIICAHFQPVPVTQGNRVVFEQGVRVLRDEGFRVVLLLQFPFDNVDTFINELSQLVDEVFLVEPLRGLGGYKKNRSNIDLYNPSTVACVDYIINKYLVEVVFAHYVHMAFVFEKLPDTIKKVLITHDVLSRLPHLGIPLKKHRICNQEEEAERLSLADIVVAINPVEQRMLKTIVPDCEVISVGLANRNWPVAKLMNDNTYISLFTASGNVLNVEGLKWFLGDVWPKVRERLPLAVLRVTGNIRSEIPESLKSIDGVAFLGVVDNLDEEFNLAKVIINCTRKGTGLKIKSIEAISRGKALISTSNGVEGIHFTGNAPFKIADEPNDFANGLIKLLSSNKERLDFEQRAKKYTKDKLNIKYVYAPLLNVIGKKARINYSLINDDSNLINSGRIKQLKSNNINEFVLLDKKHCYDQEDFIFKIEKLKAEINTHTKYFRGEIVVFTKTDLENINYYFGSEDGKKIQNLSFTVLKMERGRQRLVFDLMLPHNWSVDRDNLFILFHFENYEIPFLIKAKHVIHNNAGLIGIELLSKETANVHYWVGVNKYEVKVGSSNLKLTNDTSNNENHITTRTLYTSWPFDEPILAISPCKGMGQEISHLHSITNLEPTDQRISQYKNCHAGQVGWLIGNGPSVRTEDLNLLKNEITFSFNRFYLAHRKTVLRPTYTVSGDKQMIEDFGQEIIDESGGTVFISSMNKPNLKGDFFWLKEIKGFPSLFSFNPSYYVTPGGSSMYVAMQLAHYMGIKQLFVYGADFSFTYNTVKDNSDVFRSASGDGNHFIEGYRSGKLWCPPSFRNISSSFLSARLLMEVEGGNVFNATHGGFLEIFKRVNFYDVIKELSKNRMD